MTYESAKVWIDGLQFAWIIVATIWAFWGNKSKETTDKVAVVEKKSQDHERWLTRLNEQVKHLPTGTELEELVGDVKGLKAEVKGMSDAFRGMTRQLELINGYLLEQAKR